MSLRRLRTPATEGADLSRAHRPASSSAPPSASGAARTSGISRGRRRLFAVVTVLLPFAGLLLVEGGLRLGGYGEPQPLFVPGDAAGEYLMVNSQVLRRFVPNPARMPRLSIRPVAFRAEKNANTFRVFIQGGSTAAGYPYGYGASPAGMLQQRLQRTFPERRIEVVTTAVSAVNSYTLLDFSEEILEQEPDAVVIYAGHNEYLGILGVGSSYSVGSRRPLVLAFLAMKDLRLLRLGQRALAAATAGLGSEPGAGDRGTLMQQVVAEDRIPYGSELYRRGLAQYRANLRALLARYREAGVPVYVGTLVSNEGDQPPFISGHAPAVDVTAWRRHFDSGVAALDADEPAAALEAFDAAVALDDLHADVHFGRGRALEALERYGEAREAYRAARDRDELRFRAPRAMNEILREVAAAEGARVVEVEEAFAALAEHGIVGHTLMLEHLHPNLSGYFTLADAFYDALREAGEVGEWERPVPEEQALRELPVTAVDRLYGLYRIRKLTSGWPFSDGDGEYEPPSADNPVERIAQGWYGGAYPWPDAMRRLLDHYRSERDFERAARVAALVADAFPHRVEDQVTAARLLRRAGRSDYAVYRRRARDQREAARVAGS